uniref:NADH-ubiquinone oxidoreductase chain 2 n=1 Tax=Ismarus sp. ZJUH_2016020 TaxID=2491162 RepID=A0A3Q8UA47_9HYME|nr:NADH dehydrogenase subunit 2 [Ismarus sp. ZJUH_2016020]
MIMLNYFNLFLWFMMNNSMIISISSNSIISIWMGMEMNMLTFSSMLIFNSFYYKNSSIKYFLIQSFSSMILMYFFFLISMNNNFLNLNFSLIMINFMIIMKMGLPPLFNWYLNLMNNLNWNNCLNISIIQKIIPFYLMNFMLNFNNLIINNMNLLLLMMSMMFCSINSMKQILLKMIFSYSSIIHTSWMIFILMFNETLWMIYFLTYSFISISLMMFFKMYNMNFINNFMLLKKNIFKIMFFINILTISGLPPFMGFLMKWLSASLLINKMNFFILILFTLNSLIMMFYYLRIFFNSMMFFNNMNKFNINNMNLFIKSNKYIFYINIFSIMNLLYYEMF